jgi:hypothetical protein
MDVWAVCPEGGIKVGLSISILKNVLQVIDC